MRQAALPSTLFLILVFLGSFWGPTAPAPSKGAPGRAISCEEFTHQIDQLRLQPRTQVILATVSDPLSSGLSYAFDLQVDAIQRALAQTQYSLERFWLPWNQLPDGGTECRSYPGFLLASRAPPACGGDREHVLVLLVGETPTSGINVAQMDCAKQMLAVGEGRALTNSDGGFTTSCAALDAGAIELLGVLGPTFSGSVPSLGASFPKDLRCSTVSGSATADTIELPGRFRRTVLPDDLVMGKMLDFLGEMPDTDTERDVALLVESNTAYGVGFSDAGVHLQVPFPLHVHRLREEATTAPVAPPGLPAELALPIFQDQRSGAAAIPQFSHTTESYDDRVLEDTLQSLAREKIRFIGILATDDQDKLFLARRVRAFCPNATLFTLESSLLLTHPSEARVATGMLVASTYPLIPLNQVWTPWRKGKPEFRQTFADQTAEGTFNAALVLLNDQELADYAWPFAANDPEAPDAGRAFPPVWISVVGNGAMWPLRVFDVSRQEAEAGQLHQSKLSIEGSEPGHVSAPWGVVFLFLVATGWVLLRVFSFWVACQRAHADRVPLLLFPFSDAAVADALFCTPNAHFRQKPGWVKSRRRQVRWALHALFLAVLIGYAGVVWTMFTPTLALGLAINLVSIGVTALGGAGLGALLFTSVFCGWAGAKWLRGWRGVLWAAASALSVGLIALAICWGRKFHWSPDCANHLLWYERMIGFSNGVSPAVPFLFLWLGVVLTLQRHLDTVVNAPLALHAPTGRPVVHVLLDNDSPVLSNDLLEASKPRWPLSGLLAPALIVVVPLTLFWVVYRTPLDGRLTQRLMEVGVSLVCFGLGWALTRAVVLFRNLQRLLRLFWVGSLPRRLEPFFATLPPKQFGRLQVLQPTVRMLAEFLAGWRELRKLPRFRLLDLHEKMEDQLSKDLRRFDTWPAWGSLSFEFLRRAAICVSLHTEGTSLSWLRQDKPRITLLGAYIVLMVSWALGTLRNFLLLATALAAILWLAFVSYPQSPHHFLLIAAWLAMGLTLVIGILMLLRLERNEALSAMSRTTPGAVKFDATVLKTLVPLFAGPVLAIVVLQFPGLGRWLAEWAQPVLRAMK